MFLINPTYITIYHVLLQKPEFIILFTFLIYFLIVLNTFIMTNQNLYSLHSYNAIYWDGLDLIIRFIISDFV